VNFNFKARYELTKLFVRFETVSRGSSFFLSHWLSCSKGTLERSGTFFFYLPVRPNQAQTGCPKLLLTGNAFTKPMALWTMKRNQVQLFEKRDKRFLGWA